MKNHLKVRIFGEFINNLKENHNYLDAKQRYSITYDLHKLAFEFYMKEIKSFSDSHNEKTIELEQHKKLFHDHINMIEKAAKTIITSFKAQGFVVPEIDKKTNKPYLKGRTTMVDEMVVFLNCLNVIVMDFYKDVYKIQTKQQAKDAGIEQITIF